MAIADARRQANVSTDVLKLMLPCPDAKASGNAFAQVLNSGFAADQLKMISQVFIIAGPSWKDLKDIALTHADDSSKELFLRSTFVTLVGHAFLQTDLQGLSHAQLSFLAKHARVVVTETDLISLLQHPLDDSQMYLLGNTLQPVTLKTEAGVLALAQSSNRTLLNGRVLITDERLLATALKAGFGASELKSFVGAEQLHPGPLVAAFEKQKVPDAVIVDFLLANRNKVYLEPLDIAALSESTLLGSQIGRLVMDSSHAALQISPGIVARLKLKGVEDEAILGLTFARHEGMPSPPDIMRTNYGDPMARLDPLNGHAESSKSNDNGSPRNEDGYGPASGGGRGAGVYRIGGDVSAPILISKIEPEYSDDARKACYSGTALLSIVVDANGLPRDIHLIRSVGLGLDQKAIEAVLKWRFRPGMKDGRPVATQAQVEINFRLASCSSRANGSTQKTYKDRAEYDLFANVTKTHDPTARLMLLDRWVQQYPNTDFRSERLQYIVATLGELVSNNPTLRQRLIDSCGELLAIDPKNFRALYLITLWGPIIGGSDPSPDLRREVYSAANGVIEGIDAAFDPSRKRTNVSDADFAKAKLKL